MYFKIICVDRRGRKGLAWQLVTKLGMFFQNSSERSQTYFKWQLEPHFLKQNTRYMFKIFGLEVLSEKIFLGKEEVWSVVAKQPFNWYSETVWNQVCRESWQREMSASWGEKKCLEDGSCYRNDKRPKVASKHEKLISPICSVLKDMP